MAPNEWPVAGMDEECAKLHGILVSRHYSSLKGRDKLACSLNPKGVFTVASGYQELLSRRLEGREVHWWKHMSNIFSWPKCNYFSWTLSFSRCLTLDNSHKQGFLGPSICVLCGDGEEDSLHLFFRCPFYFLIWHYWWGVWKHPCVHADSLVDFWNNLGRPPILSSFHQTI